MTLPSNSSNRLSPNLDSSSTTAADMDVNSLMNNREFQELLQEYFHNSTMTLDEFLENLPRFMMENYGISPQELDEDYASGEDSDFDNEDGEEDTFSAYLRQSNLQGARHGRVSLDTSEVLFRSLLAGRREAREIPLRRIQPQSPPPSPVPNIVNTASSIPFFQRNFNNRMAMQPPNVPVRPEQLRRVPSQLRRSTTSGNPERFDPNASSVEDCKSPNIYPTNITNIDRNNSGDSYPITNAYMNLYGHSRVISDSSSSGKSDFIEEFPDR